MIPGAFGDLLTFGFGWQRGLALAKALQDVVSHSQQPARTLDWRKKMSDNIAYALLTYTGLQIFMTMGRLHSKNGSLLPYFALIVLVVAIIPACRHFERRWAQVGDEQAADPTLASRYRHDRFWLWALAIGLPFAVTGLFMALAMLFGHG